MSWNERSKDEVLSVAGEHGLDVASGASKAELIEALNDAGVVEPGNYEVYGTQPVSEPPLPIPITRADFAKLVENPDLPSQNQSAPAQDQLNPHLFRQR